MNQNFRDFACWKLERVRDVINKEAIEVNQAIFLATHAPFRRIAYELSPRAMGSTDEGDFLSELLERTEADLHTFAVVKGIPGTGKSHLIRWLKERYALERSDDKVILLTRARTSLKGALEQILDAGVFDSDEPREFQKLRNAVSSMTTSTLDDKLVDAIRNAAVEHGESEFEDFDDLMRTLKEPESVRDFLNDGNVRRHLKRDGGVIQRVLSFLSEGSADNMGVDDFPGFEDADLKFPTNVLRAFDNEGYESTKRMAQQLAQDEDARQTAINYFNYLLRRHAIQSATSLTAQDLKELFLQIRRHLKTQGKKLALFVEDITSLTGVESGLLEVLITQHIGDSSLCQITSVIGTTDEYYSTFQRNIVDRMTHRLSLNAEGRRAESDFTRDGQGRTELVARYLNAIRHATNQDLERWRDAGAIPAQLPNACDACRFRQPCHQTFGSVELEMGEDGPIEVGLYPFNRKSLDTLYGALSEDASRTPRGLLDKIISYILSSHTARIENGEFPPVLKEICPHVELRTPFNPTTHERLIESQAGEEAGRVKTLLLVWGDGNASTDADNSTIGGVSRTMLDVFRLPQVQGTSENAVRTATTTRDTTTTTAITAPDSKAESRLQDWNARVSEWWSGGKLRKNEDFEDKIAELFKFYLDFQAYNISLNAVKGILVGGRFPIEGRSSSTNYKFYYPFKRDESLRDFLYALSVLANNAASSLAEWGDAMTTVRLWLKQHEPHVIRFLLDPETSKNPERHTDANALPALLAYNVMLSACLSGELKTDEQGSVYESLVATMFDERWGEKNLDNFPGVWREFGQKLKKVVDNRRALRQALSRPQGISSGDDVRFLNAPLLLTLAQDLEENDWRMPDIPNDLTPLQGEQLWAWSNAHELAKQLHGEFADVVEKTMVELLSLCDQLWAFMGEYTPKDTVNAVLDALKALRSITGLYDDVLDGFLPAKGTHRVQDLEDLLKSTELVRDLQTLPQKARFLSQYGSDVFGDLRKYVNYFATFQAYVERSGVLNTSAKVGEDERLGLKSKIRGAYNKLKSSLEEYAGGE